MIRFIRPACQPLPSLRAAPIAASIVACLACGSAEAEETILGTIVVEESRIAANEKLPLDTPAGGSHLALTPRETPGAVSIIDRSAIEARGADDTQEILKGIPGVTASSPPGSAGFVSYRGFSGSQISQLFNGISVQYDTIAARPMDSWIIDRVEAVGGASSFLYGAGAVGGSINYITKVADRDGDLTQLFASYGSNNASILALGFNRQLSRQNDTANALRVDLSRSGSNGYVDGERRRAESAAVSLLTDITPQLSHTLAYQYQHELVHRPYWGTPVRNPASGMIGIDPATRFKNYNAADGRYDQTAQWLRSLLHYRLSDSTTLRNTAYHYDAVRNFRNIEIYAFNADNSMIQRSGALLQRHEQQMSGNRLELQHRNSLLGLPSDWAAGLDYSVNRVTRFPSSRPGLIDNVNPYDFDAGSFFPITGIAPGLVPDKTNRIETVSAFLENRTRLLPQLALTSALRHDSIALGVTNKRAVTASNPAFFQRDYRPTTGRVGLVYDIAPQANVYVQYSTAADPPAGILATANAGQLQDFSLATGRQVEIGSKLDFWDGKGNATLAAYTISRKNLAIADPANPGSMVAVGKQSSKGVELAFGLRPAKSVRIQGNLALVHAQYDDFNERTGNVSVSRAGKRPTNTPATVANAWADYAFMPGWNVGADARYVSSVYADNANTIKASAYTIFGASLRYQVHKNSTLTARVKNLKDKIYADHVTSTPMLYLGAPRTFELSLATSF